MIARTVLIGGPFDGEIMQIYSRAEVQHGMILVDRNDGSEVTYKPCSAKRGDKLRVAWIHASINRNKLDSQQIITNGINPFDLD